MIDIDHFDPVDGVSSRDEADAREVSTAAIRTEKLAKTYKDRRGGDVRALEGLDLLVPRGEFFGLLGPNGAGKSTAIGMITTTVVPTGGQAWVAGFDVVELEDRVLAPVPVWAVGLEKMVSGTVQAIIAAAVVFPVVYLVHAKGAAPSIHVAHWALFVVAVLFSSLLAAAFGLFIGTVLEARKLNVLFVVIVLPVTFLGCIYYPWAALGPIPWLKYLTLINPLVYMSESLRASLTPQLPHMPTWGFLLALIGGTLIMGYVGLRSFTHRVLN